MPDDDLTEKLEESLARGRPDLKIAANLVMTDVGWINPQMHSPPSPTKEP